MAPRNREAYTTITAAFGKMLSIYFSTDASLGVCAFVAVEMDIRPRGGVC